MTLYSAHGTISLLEYDCGRHGKESAMACGNDVRWERVNFIERGDHVMLDAAMTGREI